MFILSKCRYIIDPNSTIVELMLNHSWTFEKLEVFGRYRTRLRLTKGMEGCPVIGYQGGSRERTLPTCGPLLISPKGQQNDPTQFKA